MAVAQPQPAGPAPGGLGLPRGVVILLGLAATVVVIAGMRSLSGLIGPTFLALVLTIAAHPLHRGLARRMPNWLATTICLAVVYVLIVALALALVVSGARLATMLPDYQAELADLLDDVAGRLADAGVSSELTQRMTSSLDLTRLAGFVADLVSGVFGLLSNLAFVVTLLLFMAVDGGSFPKVLAAVAQSRPHLVDSMVSFAHNTRHYLVVATVFGLIVAALDTVALWLLEVPAPLLWGLLAFLTNYIPNIGFVIGLIPPAILALLEGGPGLMLAVIVVYCVLNLVIQSGIQPKVVGDAVGLSSTLSFLSLVFWAWVIGPLGAVLAIPLSLLVRSLLLDADPDNRWLAPLVANRERP